MDLAPAVVVHPAIRVSRGAEILHFTTWGVFFIIAGLQYGCGGYPYCSHNVRCHYERPEWRVRRGTRELECHLARHECSVKYMKGRNYLFCPNTEDDGLDYLVIECESWGEYCLPLEN